MSKKIVHYLLPNEVIHSGEDFCPYLEQSICLASEISQKAYELADPQSCELFSEEGLECKVLRLGAPGWQSGRLRWVLQFEPDESNAPDELTTVDVPLLEEAKQQSPLDEIRRIAEEA